MDPAKKAQWVAELRSGTFQQARHILYELETNRYCCLGVYLKTVKGMQENRIPDSGRCFVELSGRNESWRDLLTADSIDTKAIDVVADMNDHGSTFEEIASWIESNL